MNDVLSASLGLCLLLAGGELLVRGASRIATALRVSPTIVGLTVVAAGTSVPELVVSVGAALRGNPDVAIGNVVGSNIYNILLILGLAAVVRPLATNWATIRLQWPIMVLAAFNLHLLSRDGTVDRLEGTYLLAGLVVFVVWSVRLARVDTSESERALLGDVAADRSNLRWGALGTAALAVTAGIGLLGLGADGFVSSASGLASNLGVSERVIGLTLVALGTSLPELVTSVLAARRGDTEIAMANVVGSNIFNVLGILGITAMVHPVRVNANTLAVDDWVMIAVSVLLLPLMWTGSRLTRWEGGLLLVGAVVWTIVLL